MSTTKKTTAQAANTAALTDYIANINKSYRKGNATEHTYRPLLQELLKSIVPPGIDVTNEPKRIDCGAPDYVIERKNIPIGYIEAKNIGVNLNDKVFKEQFTRYKKALSNLIITDYITFQLFVSGEPVTSATIAQADNVGISADRTQFAEFFALINKFIGYSGLTIDKSKTLANIMASKARLLAHTVENALFNTEEKNTLYQQLEGFKEVLIHDLLPKSFADMYAQTITYGMFAAKINAPSDTLTRKSVAESIAPSNTFLRNFFNSIVGLELDERIRWIVDDLADQFNYVNIETIILELNQIPGIFDHTEFDKIKQDPIIHFYEKFLTEYDPKIRKKRGVFYTPPPVVRFIVQAVDDILTQEFRIENGLADKSKISVKTQVEDTAKGKMNTVMTDYHRVQILDPACGTGAFLVEVIDNIFRNRFEDNAGKWQSYVANDLLPRIHGFEFLMAPYTIAHMKLDMILKNTGYEDISRNYPVKRRIYLTNSLEETKDKEAPRFSGFMKWLTDEANEATSIKHDTPVMVVLGNPPYSGESQNTGEHVEWLNSLLKDYKKEPDTTERLKETNPKWLNDDYVKFIRYGQHFIEKNGSGILAFITNHCFLDNSTFRGMRHHLLKTFDKIYIIDLHGNVGKKEKTPNGEIDENLFKIVQGVSINIFVKTGRKADSALADVFHCDQYGRREKKFGFLLKNNLESVKWRKLKLRGPTYFFVPKNFAWMGEYERGFGIQELFPINSVGIVTGKDSVFVNIDKTALLSNIRNFKGQADKELTRCVAYRPFDTRYIYFDVNEIERARENVMRHFLSGGNFGLVFKRGFAEDAPPVFVSSHIIDFRMWSRPGMQGGDYIAPLYLDPEPAFKKAGESRRPNLSTLIVDEISRLTNLRLTAEKETTTKTFAPIDVLDYIYGVLHSPAYRERYREFLKIGFPRIPYPADAKGFWDWAKFGGKLRRLHLMEDVSPKSGVANFPVQGTNEVEKLKYVGNKVFINEKQYFEHVPSEAWVFYIGGYQPAQKWLKDRKGRSLDHNNIEHYQKIIYVLAETEKLMRNM